MNKRALARCDGGCGSSIAGIRLEILLVGLFAIDGGSLSVEDSCGSKDEITR